MQVQTFQQKLQVTKAKHRSQLDRVCARKFQTKLDVIASVLERLEHRFDVIVDELTKYSPNARKLTAKAG